MALYICIPCRRTEIVSGSIQGFPRCPKCRYRLRYYGREESMISEDAFSDSLIDRSNVGGVVVSKTLTNLRPDPAVLEAETQLTYQPNNPDILRFLAVSALSRREWRYSVTLIKRYLAEVPDDRVMTTHLVDALLLDDRPKEAQIVLAHYLVAYPEDASAHYNMAVAIGMCDDAQLDRIIAHGEACMALSDDLILQESVDRLIGYFKESFSE